MGVSHRKELIEKAVLIIKLFENNRSVTAEMIQNRLDMHKSSAYHWLHAVSRVLPIYESGKIYGGAKCPTKQYSLLKGNAHND